MKHTFIDAAGKEQTVNIPVEALEKIKRTTDAKTTQAAVEVWLSDEGYMVNPVVADLTAKASGTVSRAASTKKRKAPTRKPDETKRMLIRELESCLNGVTATSDVEVTNLERVIKFKVGEDMYEVTLSKKRAPKTE